MSYARLFAVVAGFTIALSTFTARADSILVGTDLSNPNPGPVLCPQSSDCSIRLSQFILLSPVVIDDVKVVISGPAPPVGSNGSFNLSLGNVLMSNGSPATGGDNPIPGSIGSGNLAFLPGQFTTKVFEFSNLNIALGPGTYYLQVSGADVEWDSALPRATSAGILGQQLSCDPFISCGANLSRYDTFPSTYAMEIDGAVTPEPSTFVLLGTGVISAMAGMKRKLRSSSR